MTGMHNEVWGCAEIWPIRFPTYSVWHGNETIFDFPFHSRRLLGEQNPITTLVDSLQGTAASYLSYSSVSSKPFAFPVISERKDNTAGDVVSIIPGIQFKFENW